MRRRIGRDARLAFDGAAIVEIGHERHGGRGRGQDPSPRPEQISRPIHGAVEIDSRARLSAASIKLPRLWPATSPRPLNR